MAVGDFNGDGKLDLVIANGTLNFITVLRGDGNGGFQQTVTYSTPGAAASVAVGDFNQDGNIDLAVGASSSAVSIFLAKGDGTFEESGDLVVLAGVNAIIVGDFNNDGVADLAVTYAQQDAVSVLLSNGDGTFQPRTDYLTGFYPTGLAAGDFNSDGHSDMVVTDGADQAFSIFLGDGDGTFQPAVDLTAGTSERGWVAGDFDGDGGLDLAAASVGANSVFVALNPPIVALNPARLDFGGQGMGGASAPATLTLSNPSGTPVVISGVTVSGAFTLSNGCPATLAPGSSCVLSISFVPTAAGDASGEVTIGDNAFGGGQSVPVHGVGIGGPEVSISPASLSFAPQNIGTTSAAATVTLANPGSAALTVAGISVSGDFAETDHCVPSLAAGAQCAIAVTFAPTSAGTRTGVLTINDATLSSPQMVSLTGTGVAKPVAVLSTTSLSFRSELVNTTSALQSLTLSNTGSAPLAISGISVAGPNASDFGLQNQCGAWLAAGASCHLAVSFSPSAAGPRRATLSL